MDEALPTFALRDWDSPSGAVNSASRAGDHQDMSAPLERGLAYRGLRFAGRQYPIRGYRPCVPQGFA